MVTPLSTLIRTASHALHTEVRGSSFMGDLLGGKLGVDAYARYTEQLWFVYRALEETPPPASDPVAGPFTQPELLRLEGLERDLTHLRGAHWRSEVRALPATEAYAARVRECARDWPGGWVAHHYTRYLGDLSGGQIVRDTAEKTWGFDRKGEGVRFYVFEEIDNPAAFKRGYRDLLDALHADDLEKQRIVDECRRAFLMNMAVFEELGEEFSVPA
ncbi:biliverdin-producing heme oxygenase [Streptomyces tsukubensis]|uniref:Biliverdin-producing heme oxygenase n=1 Tax=Streptomyces tsukubensis TaxID=83656 RepID=A0A1V4A0J7_9ACTN|nr:biliverdin-producing heme oxygenase [Streptomyces tsukubensis]OON72055.1 biliverdin-producing heme oxygenase [Streptomyces tsukubensis]QFR93272.1 biliverdin-producing heme oxygenase [Streptomyces tsukubensis]